MEIVGATGLGGLWAFEWAWHPAETNLRCKRYLSVHPDGRTWLDRLG